MKVLTKAEIASICGKEPKAHNSTLIQELRFMGIEHKIRSDGSPLVFESDVIQEYPSNFDKPIVLNLDAS